MLTVILMLWSVLEQRLSSLMHLGKPKKLALGNCSDVTADLPLNKVRTWGKNQLSPFGSSPFRVSRRLAIFRQRTGQIRLSPKGNTGSRLFTEVKPCWTTTNVHLFIIIVVWPLWLAVGVGTVRNWHLYGISWPTSVPTVHLVLELPRFVIHGDYNN